MAEVNHCGLAALVGRPNSGKSTLLNVLVGEKVAIVSSKPQTTRNRIVGVVSELRGQAVFFDLPGVHRPLHRMNRKMMQEVRSALEEVDLILHLVDASKAWGAGEEFLFDLLAPVTAAVVGVLTKIDLVRPRERLLPLLDTYRRHRPDTEIVPISARTGDNLGELRETLFRLLPEGPPLYPAGVDTTQTERFFVAEVVREKLLHLTRDELPYTTGVLVESFEETPGLLRIGAVILVERQSQKAMVIGKGGRMIREIGRAAREDLEARLGSRLYLSLRVKVSPRWREDARVLVEMEPGVAVPTPEGGASPLAGPRHVDDDGEDS